MSARLVPAAALLLALAACTVGYSPQGYAGRGGRGEPIGIERLDGSLARGELLAVDSVAYLLLVDRRLVAVPFADARRVSVGQLGMLEQSRVDRTPGLRERVALRSRHPYGVPPTVMTALLAGSGQAAPDTVAVRRRRR